MPWWAWLVIWAVLVLLLLALLALFAISLFRKIRAIAIELENLASQLSRLDQTDRELVDQKNEIAILVGRAELKRRRERVRFEALVRKRTRLHASIQRAQELLRVDATQQDWFPAHSQASQHNPR